jgi:hypothetical protein
MSLMFHQTNHFNQNLDKQKTFLLLSTSAATQLASQCFHNTTALLRMLLARQVTLL